ncbi:N-acetylmuramoyl-L-alanine amidase [Croceicoccus sp. YJ47]|uniref:N-acetylmuramoyl-L-alanine amidase family protein n=1 Tax=Croceicoccus sp. YJ47 TaxID=2798724 RepID=UPI001924C13C|nr:N-acetylmuramoyl-L-alanine amidase [Croceicoccus sp. YJ47]QQN73575.1 N-acetylmuramoyl-L-alanine amidase [Croceicoccus sp. YJ47]
MAWIAALALCGGGVAAVLLTVFPPGRAMAVYRRDLPAAVPVATPSVAMAGDAAAGLPLLVIDPGHGAFDYGATATHGANGAMVMEKNVALSLAIALRDRLVALGGVRVALIREDDSFLPVEHRPRMAEQLGAAALISIHVDSAPGPASGARGATVYTLSPSRRGFDPSGSRRNGQNRGAQGQVAAGTEIAMILDDLAWRQTAFESAMLAQAVEAEARGRLALRNPFARSARFAVLASPEFPAILFEAGYLGNAEDADRLLSPEGRGEIADVLARAALGFFAERERWGE